MNYKFISANFLALGALIGCSHEKVVNNPNIILLMTDDQGWYDAGFNGNKDIITPNIDLLASEGIVFDRFYSASAVCSPTRASVITGRNPLRMDIPYANQGHMKEDEITIPEILKKEGYATGHFGKWHLGTLSKSEIDANRGGKEEFREHYSIPTRHGYDVYFSTESKVPTYDPMFYPATFKDDENMRFGWRAIQDKDSSKIYGTAYWIGENQKATENLEGDDSRVIMDRVIPFITHSVENKKPFFSTIWFHTPHLPVVSNNAHRSYYDGMDIKEQIYYGTLTAMDEQVGRLWEKLKELNIHKETIIFFCSDNGPEQRTPGSAGIFRDRKRSLYEGGIRVPAFVTWKGNLPSGKRIDFPAVTSDYMPTILDILDIEYPDNRPVDGISILPALKGNVTERHNPIGFICRPNVSWVTHRYKLIGKLNKDEFELYDLLKDQSEEKDISEIHPEIVDKMKKELEIWQVSVDSSSKGLDYK